MIEVFKTDVENSTSAMGVLRYLNAKFPTYHVNFDLNDCDKILRIENAHGIVEVDRVMAMITDFGYRAEPLE